MAGGIFVNQPFHFNPKCVIFAIILMVFYWFLPPKEVIMLPLIFIVGYIAMAWYDQLYNCDIKLKSGTSPVGMATFDAWAKPQTGEFDNAEQLKEGVEYVPDQVVAYRRNVNYFHIFGVMGGFLAFALWVNYVFGQVKSENPDATDEEIKELAAKRLIGVRYFLGIFGGMAALFHGYRLFVKQRPLKEDDDLNYMYGINILHIVIGLFMVWVSYDINVDSAKNLGGIGIFAGAFHGFLLFSKNK